MSRPIRKITPTFKIFCEGDTEYNYFEGLRQNSSFSITIKTIDMSGGGYSNFLNRLKSDSNTNCIGKIIVIDGDKIATDEGEKRQFLELLQFCQNQNKPVGGKKSTRIPYILVVNYEDFEYVACLHNKYYKGTGRSSSFITGTFKYKTIDEFKKDKKVYQFLTKNGTSEKDANSIENMIEAVMKRPKIVSNSISRPSTKNFELTVEGPVYNEDRVGIQASNFEEIFKTLDLFK